MPKAIRKGSRSIRSLRIQGFDDKSSTMALPSRFWSELPWKSVDVSEHEIGTSNFDEAVFLGLEEIDGNEFLEHKNRFTKQDILESGASELTDLITDTEPKTKKQKKTKTTAKLESPKMEKAKKIESKGEATTTMAEILNQSLLSTGTWGSKTSLVLSQPLCRALDEMGFNEPTPIQGMAIQATLSTEICDIVGVAETGSGKTLSFALPIVQSLLANWQQCLGRKIPYALIISPTRELAMQTTSVIKDICKRWRSYPGLETVRVEVAAVVGGMSEDKQRRLLDTSKRPLHIVVATPGRLCEIFEDTSVVAFSDLSLLRFLVVDEADRIMEEGHFAELHRVFNRIRDHENIVLRGEAVEEVMRRRRLGIDEPGEDIAAGARRMESAADDCEEEEDIVFPAMPSEEELRRAAEEAERDTKIEAQQTEMRGESAGKEQASSSSKKKRKRGSQGNTDRDSDSPASALCLTRQTLLFSATALRQLDRETDGGRDGAGGKGKKAAKAAKKHRLHGTVRGLANNCSLPESLKHLLSLVAVQRVIRVVDVTHDSRGDIARDAERGAETDSADVSRAKAPEQIAKDRKNGQVELAVALPKELKQFEIRVPSEDKDTYIYYYLNKNDGRALIFVNSIKTARRLDGLLRALGFHSRAIHADMPQRQRLKALDTFKAAPNSILVATDVAARGLDIPKIQTVLHYDVARSPQVYIHRSGRTARAHSGGVAVSFVNPEDSQHHLEICRHILEKSTSSSSTSLPLLQVELSKLSALRERITLAKKIFTQNFVTSQSSKEQSWIEQSAKEADLDFEGVVDPVEEKVSKKAMRAANAKLKSLLNQPIEATASYTRKDTDWRKRKNGFFVFAK